MSQSDYDYVSSGGFGRNDALLAETYASFFEKLKTEGLIETFNPETVIPRISAESVERLVLSDIERFGSDPEVCEDGKKIPSVIDSCSGTFCGFALESMYMNLLASRLLGCSCLMDRHKAEFVNQRFSTDNPATNSAARAFEELYTVLIPDMDPYKDYQLFCPKSVRDECMNDRECSRRAMTNLESYVEHLLVAKSTPEIRGLSSLIEKLEDEMGDASSTELTKAAVRDITKAQGRVRSAFGKVSRWSRFVGEASVVALGVAPSTGAPEIVTPIAAALAFGGFAASVATEARMEANRWKLTFAERYIS